MLPIVEINKDPKLPKIVFLAGFPDNQTSGWGHVLPETLAADYHLIFLCLPGYEIGGTIRPWGYNFEDIIDMLDSTILSTLSSPDEKVVLVAHDWGSVISFWYLAKYGSNVSKFISLDVGMVDIFNLPLKDIFIISTYQAWFAFSFVVSQYCGSLFGTLLMAIFFLPIFSPLWPTRGEKPHVPKEAITADKCYPYYYLWKKILSGKIPKSEFPKIPTLFLYGANKNCMFHDNRFLKRLNSTPQCKGVKVEDAGHWLQITQAKLVTKEIVEFLK